MVVRWFAWGWLHESEPRLSVDITCFGRWLKSTSFSEHVPSRCLGFVASQRSCLLCLPAVLGVPSCQMQHKRLSKKSFAKGEKLEVPRHLLQSFFLSNICHLPLVRNTNE